MLFAFCLLVRSRARAGKFLSACSSPPSRRLNSHRTAPALIPLFTDCASAVLPFPFLSFPVFPFPVPVYFDSVRFPLFFPFLCFPLFVSPPASRAASPPCSSLRSAAQRAAEPAGPRRPRPPSSCSVRDCSYPSNPSPHTHVGPAEFGFSSVPVCALASIY